MRSPLCHLRHPQKFFDHFHQNVHHAFVVFVLAMVGMLWGASHILTPISANYTVGGFLTPDFWTQDPTDGNIRYALFGDGTPASTPYTRTWDTSCIPTSVNTLSTGFFGGSLSANTIYILNSGNYILTSPITMSGCSALVGNGDVVIRGNGNSLVANNRNNVILDNLAFTGNGSQTGLDINTTDNVTINNIDVSNNNLGVYSLGGKILINNSRIYQNTIGLYGGYGSATWIVNNSSIYNNSNGGFMLLLIINNSQVYNNTTGFFLGGGYINTTIFYNNTHGITTQLALMNNTSFYNNGVGLDTTSTTGIYYGTLKFFDNTSNYAYGTLLSPGTDSPYRSDGQLDTGSETMDYNRVTNPENASGSYLLNGSTRSSLRGVLSFDSTKRPLRYIFGGDILKQDLPIWYDGSNFASYGTDGIDYDTSKYIAEPDSRLSPEEQTIVDEYFGPDAVYTENRETNGCSLSAFRVVSLSPGTFNSSHNTFEDHTIYILTGGEYKSTVSNDNAFTFGGNCIALIGNGASKLTKQNTNARNLLYAENKRNIIVDGVTLDGKYHSYPTGIGGLQIIPNSGPVRIGINLAGTSNNITISNVQIYNTKEHGVSLGQGSHHNTISNAQIFNNLTGGIYLTYASNYNVINNAQIYNNGSYGIWLANGSHRNTINNTQIYNNGIGIFGDQTTQNNIINNSAIYNNSVAGVSFKNSSNNILNEVMIFNNTKGIQTIYNSVNNVFYGALYLFNNTSNLDGTSANDGYLTPGDGSDFAYGGILSTGSNVVSCTYVSNPSLSGSSTSLLNDSCNNTGQSLSFVVANSTLSYMYGLNVYKQSVPVRYESGNDELIELSASYYDTSKYIAEVGAVRDNEPENISFGDTSAVELNTGYTTSVYTAGTMNTTVSAYLSFSPSSTSGYLIINGVASGTGGTISNGDALQLYVLTPSGYGETVTATLTLGSVTTGIVITTRQRSQMPSTGSLAFASLTSLPVDIFTGSTTTISGIETGVLASIVLTPSTTSGWLQIYSGSEMVSSGTTGLRVYNGNQVKAIAQSSSGYARTITGYITIGQGTGVFTLTTKGADSVAPTIPSITYPLSGEKLFFVTFNRNASTDTGSGIEGYEYEIAEDNEFLDIVDDGFISTTGTAGSPDTDFDATSDTYYVRIRAKDRDDNYSSRSNIGYFEAKSSNDREFSEKTKANLRTYYDSDEITIAGAKPGISIWACIDGDGTLYKNGVDKGTGTFVQNDDDLYITLRSSSRYDKTVSSTLTIANRSLEFIITTKEESDTSCDLSSGDTETIQNIFDSLIDNYSGDETRYNEFLYTIQSMLEDQIDFTNDCNLQYLQNLINGELGITSTGSITTSINTGIHIAPNCKEYPISYDSTRMGYTSSGFKVITFFANRDTLGRYIDSKNPGDCHITTYGAASWMFSNTNPSRHIASNGKIYLIQSDAQGYSSSDFVVKKYFSTLAALRNYIDSKNLPQAVRSHTVDTSFTPQSYIAPNGKEYSIYRTNRGYMSYKLLNVRYFSSLSELQTYINRNNPK